MIRQWATTVILIDDDKVLLVYHKKLEKWVPPGGHVEENELLHEAAFREVMEETGLEVEILHDEHLHVHESNAKSIPRPFLLQLESIPAYQDQPAHEHIDAIFIGRVLGELTPCGEEKAFWCPIDELEDYPMFNDSREAIRAAREASYV